MRSMLLLALLVAVNILGVFEIARSLSGGFVK
jgi:hypothetical protein